MYRKPSPYNPSQYLISKLRSYEMLHKRPGPGRDADKREYKGSLVMATRIMQAELMVNYANMVCVPQGWETELKNHAISSTTIPLHLHIHIRIHILHDMGIILRCSFCGNNPSLIGKSHESWRFYLFYCMVLKRQID